MKEKKSWYPQEDGKSVIEIQVDYLEQLFDKRDPNPYRSKDLDDDVDEYLISSSQEIGHNKIGKLRILSLENANDQSLEIVKTAIKDFFNYRYDITDKKLKTVLALGFKTLLIGLFFLSIAIFISHSLGKKLENDFFGHFVKEGLILIGWVSMWKPINIFLYEWLPLVEQKKIFKLLSEVPIEILLKQEEQTLEDAETH